MSGIERTINKLLNIREGEGGKLLLFFLLNVGMGLVFVFINSGIQAVFLKKFGASFLPYVIIFTALFNAIGAIFYAFLVDTIRSDRVFHGIFFVMIIILYGVSYSMRIPTSPDAITLASLAPYVASYALVVMTLQLQNMQLNKFVSVFYDTLESKRLFSLISTGARVGTIAGGFSLGLILTKIDSSDIPFVCMILVVINIIFVQLISTKYRVGLKASMMTRRRRYGKKTWAGLENIKQGYQFVKKSELLKVTAVASIAMMLSLEILRYHYSWIFQNAFEERDQLTAFLGGFAAVSNILAMIIPLFITPRLVNWFGVGTVNIFYPVSIFLGYFSFFVSPFLPNFTAIKFNFSPNGLTPEFISAAFGRFVKVPLRKTLFQPVNYLIYNAVPHTLRGRANAFINGIMLPLGSIFAGIFLLIAKEFNFAGPKILYVGVVFSIVMIFISFFQKQKYVDSLITLLRGRNVDLKSVDTEDIAKVSAGELNRLVQTLNEEQDEAMSIFTVEVLGQVGGSKIVQALMDVLNQKSDRVKESIVKVLGNIADSSVLPVIVEFLDSPIEYLRRRAVIAVWKLGEPTDIAPYLSKLVNDPSPGIRGTVICLLTQNPDEDIQNDAIKRLEVMLHSENVNDKVAALDAIGEVRINSYRDKIIQYFDHPQTIVKTSSLRAFNELISEEDKQYLELITKLLQSSDRAVRREASELIVKVSEESILPVLLQSLNDLSPRVRRNIIQSIVKIGKSATEPLVAMLKDVSVPLRAKENAIIALDKIGTVSIRGFLLIFAQTELKQAYQNITQIAVLEKVENRRAVELLIKALEDKNEEIKSVTLKILETLGNAEVLRLIERTLRRRDVDSRTKANALETLGNVGEKELIRLMLPLYDSITNQERANFAEEKWEMKRSDISQILYFSLGSADRWIKACAIFSIGELGREGFTGFLKKSLRDDEEYVRETAQEALRKLKQKANDKMASA